MNVLLVSQCNKRALKQTRRVLDQFAERRGDRTWQTPITQAGLDTLRKLLRKTARKNTAVACHWIRGHDHSELLWIVGNARRFNAVGGTPTNRTTRNILRTGDENDWHSLPVIQLLARLAALLHDLGKATVAFQERLDGKRTERNLYRHEWVSLRLFLAFVGKDDDKTWLARLAAGEYPESDWTAKSRYQRDGLNAVDEHPFRDLPPIAAAVAWLVVTHHRLPVIPVHDDKGEQCWLGKRAARDCPTWLDKPLHDVAHDWNEIKQTATRREIKPYWDLAGPLPVVDDEWRKQAGRVAGKLQQQGSTDWLDNPYVMHLARLSLMLADHHYSSLTVDKHEHAVNERKRFKRDHQTIFANTRRNKQKQRINNQSLLEHLLGVGHGAGQIAHALPDFERHLPRLANHRGLRKRSRDKNFAWQDKAFDAAEGMREATRTQGGFIVNMASTGCGKTLANARILYALAEPQLGMRATFALGLRTLTMQTGRSYHSDLNLGDDELATLVGGTPNRKLFDYYRRQAEESGSASTQSLLPDDSHVLFEGDMSVHPLLKRAMHDRHIVRLLSPPLLVCTVDHIVPATEALRAGRQIAPMLRLMSSDLVLDELDDFNLEDLPALTRLVHWAGLLGSRVLLSSATLPPALVEGMFRAYHAGREHYLANRGELGSAHGQAPRIPCLWVDEFGARTATCADGDRFADEHAQFVAARSKQLEAQPALRTGEILPLGMERGPREKVHAQFAAEVHAASLRLHEAHAETDPKTDKRASFGMVRMANIDPIIDVGRALFATAPPADTCIHLCVYHARFPLVQRSAIEDMLDGVFNRRQPGAIWQHPAVRAALDADPRRNHLFVVLASPVCEVGRDWDADWAVVEPSSMRSLIQLAGRVQRHRKKPCQSPNVLVFDANLRFFTRKNGRDAVFVRPGFEAEGDDRFRLDTHRLSSALRQTEYQRLDAIPRIQPQAGEQLKARQYLADLEHARLKVGMLGTGQSSGTMRRRRQNSSARLSRDQASTAWMVPSASLTGVLPQQQPFRANRLKDVRLVYVPNDDDEEAMAWCRVEKDFKRRDQENAITTSVVRVDVNCADGVQAWGAYDLKTLLQAQADDQDKPLAEIAMSYSAVDVRDSDQGWLWYPWLGVTDRK